MSEAARQGVILFGHGARDPRWAEPFERLRGKVACLRDGVPVVLAYLEMMTPDLDTATDALVAEGCTDVTIVPIFFGQGSHLRRDLPLQVDALRARLPAVTVTVAEAAGEDDAVLAAVADYCVRSSTVA
ncbi:MAG: CbiX/SirB N-terminal domain-containing protein [Burkholderiaceae bacterium]